MSWLLDTNVLSELRKLRPEPRVTRWVSKHEDSLFLSVLTLGELEKGIRLHPERAKRQLLSRWLEEEVIPWFSGRILPIDEAVSRKWGQLLAEAKQPLPAVDALIGATALTHDLIIATRNVSDLARTGAPIINPWDE